MDFTGKFEYMVYHFILLQLTLTLQLIDRDGGLSILRHSCQFALKTFTCSGYLSSEDAIAWLWHLLVNLAMWLAFSSCYNLMTLVLGLIGRNLGQSTLYHSCGSLVSTALKTGPDYLWPEDSIVWPWHILINFYMWLTILSCYGSIPVTLGLIRKDDGFITMYHSWQFSCQQRVLKTFTGSGYLLSGNRVFWLLHFLVNVYIWLTISSCSVSISLTLGLIERHGSLSTLCHNYGFACQKRVLKTLLALTHFTPRVEYMALKMFLGPDCLHFNDGIVWLWHLVVNLYLWLTISSCYGSISLTLGLIARDGGLSTLYHKCQFSRW